MAGEWSIVEGKHFLVTGGATGLGAVYAENFLKLGAGKVAILDIAVEAGQKFAKTLNQTYTDKVIFIKCDVSNEDEIIKRFDEVLAAFKRIDVIINNAGVMNDSPHVWRKACDVNWQGVVSFTLKGIEHMRKDEGGSGGTIINVSSSAALVKLGMLPIYCGSKAAVLHFIRSIATPEFNESTGIRIMAVAFGGTDTPLLTNIPEKVVDSKVFIRLAPNMPKAPRQSVDSACKAVIKMYKEGAPGSAWFSTNDEPGKDITSLLDKSYKPLEQLLFPDA